MNGVSVEKHPMITSGMFSLKTSNVSFKFSLDALQKPATDPAKQPSKPAFSFKLDANKSNGKLSLD